MRTVIAQVARVLLVTMALGFIVAPLMTAGSDNPAPSTSYADGFDWH